MLTIAFILFVIAFVAAIFGFGLMQAPIFGPARIACYFFLLLAVAILSTDIIEEYQHVGLYPANQPIAE